MLDFNIMNVNLMEFIPPELLIMVVGLYIIGSYLKMINKIKDEYIPSILFPLAVISACLFLGGFTITNFYIGVASWGIAIGFNQVGVQYKKLKSK
ncbi:phage holin family protein [Fusobacterium sp.]|uniref:phage holin family protein n=1 Tax=Fusobacterium sp. TaxID=68766 RepID=UPI002639FD1B|nr:phage holin family protein [Fusobacterium sp.]